MKPWPGQHALGVTLVTDQQRLAGKVALVTGAAGAIGAATIRLLLARDASVLAVDRDVSALHSLRATLDVGDRFSGLEGDVGSEASVRDFVENTVAHFGRIDILFNNAGIEGSVRPLTETPLADFRRVLDINVVGVFLGMKYVIPVMVKQGFGAIVNASSTAGLTGAAGVCAYNASKHAVIGLTRSACAEWAAKGIRINAIAPGPIDSRMMSSLEAGFLPGDPGAVRLQLTGRIPAGRYGSADEVAAMVAFLASDDALYLNGGVFPVDGGYLVH